MSRIDELKTELSGLIGSIILLTHGEEIDVPAVPIIGAAMTERFLREELQELGVPAPKAETIEVDWSLEEPFLQDISRRWVRLVAEPLLPMARALETELKRREAERTTLFGGDEVTPDMLDALKARFND